MDQIRSKVEKAAWREGRNAPEVSGKVGVGAVQREEVCNVEVRS